MFELEAKETKSEWEGYWINHHSILFEWSRAFGGLALALHTPKKMIVVWFRRRSLPLVVVK
jgi:hypothetical protein